jgi:uncharacterized protein YjbI with pentapeptide repeats
MPAEPKPEMTRDEEIRELMKDYPGTYRIAFALMLVGVGIFIGAALFRGDQGYTVNLYTEVLSIAVTVFILDYLNRRRDERNAERALKEQLVRDAGSTSNEVAKNAVHQLRKIKEGKWLIGDNGLLQCADLTEANLCQADLSHANLEGSHLAKINLVRAKLSWTNMRRTNIRMGFLSRADLGWAQLTEASLGGCDFEKATMPAVNLSKAFLQGAILTEAQLHGANLKGADLRFAIANNAQLEAANLQSSLLFGCKFQGANLRRTKLQGANLVAALMWNADLKGAELQGAITKNEAGETLFDETTILPDGTNWTPGRDMRQFTHPDEWAREHPDTQQP